VTNPEPSRRRSLREQLARREAMLVPGAANAMTARIIEDLGFSAVYVTGAGISNISLGMPDVGLMTLSELADVVHAIREAVGLPLIVDADTGFGNAINTWRTVRVLESAGADAIQLEDQVFPKRCGHFSGKSVIAAPEMVEKIRAAVEARHDGDFQIIARTDVRALEGLDAAIDRAGAFIAAGADATFVEAPESVAELAEIPRRLAVPQVANLVVGGKTPLLPQAELARLGYGVVLYANVALQAALQAMQTVLGALRREGSIDAVAALVGSFAERQRIVGKARFDELEARYRT
jgi:2-methylisocitrate lyase-like PEP mutase family enzyme